MHPDIKAKNLELRKNYLQNCLGGKIVDDEENSSAGKCILDP